MLAVIQHRPVNQSFGIAGKKFQILKMGGYDSPHSFPVEFGENSLSYGPADLRLRACSELVDEHQGGITAHFYELLHVGQVGRVGGKIVENRLIVPYVYKKILEYTHARVLVKRG